MSMFGNMVFSSEADSGRRRLPGEGPIHLHLHSCEICSKSVVKKGSGVKGLKMCPCAEAFYCGSEHQEQHWTVHKRTCYARHNKAPTTAADDAVKLILRSYDSNMVQLAVSALLRESKYIDITRALDAVAIEILVTQRPDYEDMEVAWAAGRVPPFKISTKAEDIRLLSLSQEAQRRGLGRPFFEHPDDRTLRIRNEKFGIAMIFQPTGRVVTFRAPKVQLGAWEMIQGQEQHTTNPPHLYWSIHMTNGILCAEFSDAQKIRAGPAPPPVEGKPGTNSPPLQDAVVRDLRW
ncbi:hypothetical protein DFH06DRAFT_365796 [Mycena polygramma]|nr:hypothetical protein DFH06DRAFT_365796 [Mycena polygramma]